MSRLPDQEDLQALRRRRVPAFRVRAHVPRGGAERRTRVTQGSAGRRPGGPSRPAGLGRSHRLQPRPGRLPDRRDAGGAPRRARAALLRRSRGRPLDRPPRLVRRLGGQARAGDRRNEPGRRPLFQLHDPRADRRGRDPRARRACARGFRLARHSRDRRRERDRGRRLRAAPARSGRARRGARDRRCPGWCRQHPHRPPRRARAVARRAHGRECDRRHRCRRSRRRSWRSSRPRT